MYMVIISYQDIYEKEKRVTTCIPSRIMVCYMKLIKDK